METKKIYSLISILLILSACSKRDNNTEILRQQIVQTDKLMSDMAVKEGFFRALNYYADEDFVKLNEGNYPVVGKKAFEELYKNNPGPKSLTWEPLKAEVAESGELGYSWGNWKFILTDTILYGNYFTVWKRKPDGIWKMALDGGNGTPPPKKF